MLWLIHRFHHWCKLIGVSKCHSLLANYFLRRFTLIRFVQGWFRFDALICNLSFPCPRSILQIWLGNSNSLRTHSLLSETRTILTVPFFLLIFHQDVRPDRFSFSEWLESFIMIHIGGTKFFSPWRSFWQSITLDLSLIVQLLERLIYKVVEIQLSIFCLIHCVRSQRSIVLIYKMLNCVRALLIIIELFSRRLFWMTLDLILGVSFFIKTVLIRFNVLIILSKLYLSHILLLDRSSHSVLKETEHFRNLIWLCTVFQHLLLIRLLLRSLKLLKIIKAGCTSWLHQSVDLLIVLLESFLNVLLVF